MEFNPPIKNREIDELIVISKSSTNEYQEKAILLANKELKRRKIFQSEINNRFNELIAEHKEVVEQAMTEIAVEDYSVFKKIWIIIFWPRELFHGCI